MNLTRKTPLKKVIRKPTWIPSTNDLKQGWKYKQRGYTDTQIAEKMHISISTYKRNKERIEKYYEKRRLIEKHVLPTQGDPKDSKALSLANFPVDSLRTLLLAGLPHKDIALCLGLSHRKFEKYKKEFPEINRIVKTTELLAISDVVKTTYNRATGMKIPAVHFASYMGQITAHHYNKYIPPSERAAELLLYNSKLVDFQREGNQSNNNSKGLIREALEFMQQEESISITEDNIEYGDDYQEKYSKTDITEADYEESA